MVPIPTPSETATTLGPSVPDYLKLPYLFRVEARGKKAGQKIRKLKNKVKVTIDFDDLAADDWGQTFAQLYYFDESAGRWTLVPAQTDMVARRIVADLDHFTDFGFGGDVNTLPSAPSNLEGFSVDLCTGYTRAGISLKVPPGILGLAPSLDFGYNSGILDTMNEHWIADGNNTDNENARTRLQASPAGLGWALGLGAVFRSPETDAQGNPRFYLVRGTRTFELVWVDGTEFRTDPDEFLRVRRLTGASNECASQEYWLIEAKDGTQYRYGFTPDSEQRAGKWQFGQDGVQKAWQWSLDQIMDTHSNRIDIQYLEVSAQPPAAFNDTMYYDEAAYPSTIRYTANTPQSFAANREVRFTYSDRTDAVAKTANYTQYYWTKKLDRVEMYAGGTLARSYELGYQYQTPNWHTEAAAGVTAPFPQATGLPKLLLTSITEKDGSGNALPASTFSYYQGTLPGGSEPAKLQMATVSNGYGGVATYSYEGHTPDGWWRLPRRYRVKEQRVDPGTSTGAGVDGVMIKTYGYGTSYNVSGSDDYRGHGWVTVTDSAGHYNSTFFYTRDAANGKVAGEVANLQTRPYASESYAAGRSSWTTREETDWGFTLTAGVGTFPHVDEVRSFVRTQTGDQQTRKTRYSYDGYGNVVSVKEYASATAGVDQWVRQRVFEYYPSTGYRYLVGYLAREALLQPSRDALRDTRYCYDGSTRHDNPIGTGQYGDDGSFRGRLTAVRRVLDAARSVDVTYGYDGFGHRTSMTEYDDYGVPGGPLATADPRTSTVAFETVYQTYPYQVTNPLGHQATRSYDARWGVVTQATDPNAGVSDYSYDGWGRLTAAEGPQVSGPAGSYRPTTRYFYSLPSTTGSGRTTTMLKTQVRTDTGGTSPSWRSSWRFNDGIGRAVQEYAEAAQGVNVSNGYFDTRGLKGKASVPHLATASESFLETDWAGYSGAATTSVFDELGRVTQTTLPDGQVTRTVYDGWAREGIDQKGHKHRYESDWAGRMVAVKEYTGSGPSYQLYATTSYGYDLANELTSVVDAAGNSTTIGYDGLGRKVGMTDPDMGTWSYEYDPIGTLVAQTDARGQRVEMAYDSLNRLMRKWYPAFWSQESITVSQKPCVHDLMELRCAVEADRVAAGLAEVGWTDPEIVAGRDIPIRAVHFTELRSRIEDLWTAAGMGAVPEYAVGPIVAGTRRISTSDPEELRVWLRQYEDSGYGQAHRARAYYRYDEYDGTAQFGRGRRTALWDMSGKSTFTWDKLGRLVRGERSLDGRAYASQGSYDAMGRVYQATYPDGEVVTYSYGANGLLTGMASSLGDSYLSGVEYNELNLPKRYLLGGTSPVRHSYYGLDYTSPSYPYGALRTIRWPEGSGSLVDRTMGYDPVGNVSSVDDGLEGESIAYSYDDLDRLLSAGAPVNESYSYDQIGNLTSKNGQALVYGDPAHVHAVTAFGSAAYGYDANGCMVTRGSQTVRYDPERRPVKVDENGVTEWRATYDGDGSRRKRLDGKGTIHYVGPYERSVGNGQDVTEVVTKYYRASMGGMSRLLAMRKNGVLAWVGTDHLGGTIRVADSAFSPLDQMRYTPYGVDRDPGTHLNTDHKFTSQIHDESIALYWYASRAYDPVLGRFVCPDSLVPSPSNPQALNRYSYVLNNPLTFLDLSGHATLLPERRRTITFEGAPVVVVEYARGIMGALVDWRAGPRGAMVLDSSTIYSYDALPDGSEQITHELGHIRQARRMGVLYLPEYVTEYNQLQREFSSFGYLPAGDLAYKYHPMEIDANLEQGLDRYWHSNLPSFRDIKPLIGLPSSISGPAGGSYPSDIVGTPTVSPEGKLVIPVAGRPSDVSGISDNVELTIPAEYAPGGVGVVGISSTNPSGGPANGGSWDSPGGANAQADAEARRAAWEAAGSPDYNQLRREGKPGY